MLRLFVNSTLFLEGSLYWSALTSNQLPLRFASTAVTSPLHSAYYYPHLELTQTDRQKEENHLKAAHRFIQETEPITAEGRDDSAVIDYDIMMEMIQHNFFTSYYYHRLLLIKQ